MTNSIPKPSSAVWRFVVITTSSLLKFVVITTSSLVAFAAITTSTLLAGNTKERISKTASVDWTKAQLQIEESIDLDGGDGDILEKERKAKQILQKSIYTLISRYSEKIRFDRDYVLGEYLDANPKSRELFTLYLEKRKIQPILKRDQMKLYAVYTIPLRGADSFVADLVTEQDPLPIPDFPEIPNPPQYTGLIIDVSHLEFQPSLLPRITTERGEDIYAYYFQDFQYLQKFGVVEYQTKEKTNTSKRIGKQPYRVMATSVSGKNGTDVVITSEEANRFLGNPKNQEILKKGKILILTSK